MGVFCKDKMVYTVQNIWNNQQIHGLYDNIFDPPQLKTGLKSILQESAGNRGTQQVSIIIYRQM